MAKGLDNPIFESGNPFVDVLYIWSQYHSGICLLTGEWISIGVRNAANYFTLRADQGHAAVQQSRICLGLFTESTNPRLFPVECYCADGDRLQSAHSHSSQGGKSISTV
jgi:hypothetical protein